MATQRRKMATAETARESVWTRIRARLSLPQIESWSSSVRSVFLNALFLVAAVVILPVLISQFSRDEVVIESLGVPEALVAQGLTDTVAASRLWDGLQDTVRAARTSKASLTAIPQARQVEFSFPDSGFSIESLVFHLRRLFNAYETRIAGEFVCADAACKPEGLSLRLRVVRDGVELIDMPPIGARSERAYFADAGARVLAVLDPFVALSALSETQPLRATTLARRLIRAHHKDAKWAHNLVGLIRLNAGDVPAAADEFRAALALDPAFAPARVNLGTATAASGDLPGADAMFKAVLADDPKDVFAMQGLADVAMRRGDPDAAVAGLLQAAEADPLNPLYFAKAGQIELQRGRRPEAEALLNRSLELDPGFLPAFAVLAAVHMGEGNVEKAEKVYRDAADYAPDDAQAQVDDGNMLALLKRWPDAVARYERATVLAPDHAAYWYEYGRSLTASARPEDAMAALLRAAALDPSLAEAQLEIANLHRDAGRKADAVAAYRKFLELDKSNSPMRPIAERFVEILSE
jgi:tetratricopeptide (TPR) repeat protein